MIGVRSGYDRRNTFFMRYVLPLFGGTTLDDDLESFTLRRIQL